MELSSLKQRLDEATAISHALRLELQLHQCLSQTTVDDKENNRASGICQSRCWPTSLTDVRYMSVTVLAYFTCADKAVGSNALWFSCIFDTLLFLLIGLPFHACHTLSLVFGVAKISV